MPDANPFAKWADSASGSPAGGDSDLPATKQPKKAPGVSLGSVLAPLNPGGMIEHAAAGLVDDPAQVHEVNRGATMGFIDDLDVWAEKAKVQIQNTLRHARGQPPLPIPTDDQIRAKLKGMEKKEETEHPVRSSAEQLAGGFGTPGLGAAGDALKTGTKLPALARAGIMGVGIGGTAAAGYADGTPQERLSKVPGGAVAGGLTGGALHAAPGAAKRIAGAGQEAFDRLKAGLGHEPGAPPSAAMREKAQKTGTEAVSKMAQRLDPTGEKLKFNKTEQRGKPITAAEALGRSAETQLKVAGRRTGQTPDALESQLRARHAETADRVVNDFEKLTGIDAEAAKGDFQSEMQRLRSQAAPIYERAYAHADVDSPELTDLLKRPSMKKALANAERIAAEEGREPADIGFTVVRKPLMINGKQATQGGRPLFTEEEVELRRPSMQTWDYVKRGLDDVIEGYRKNGRLELDTEGRAAVKTLSELRDHLTDESKPWGSDYAAALNAGGEPLRQEEAFTSAKKLLSGTTSESDFTTRVGKYTDAQKQALKAGIVNHIRDVAQAGRTRMGELATPLFKAKMEAVFGKETAAELSERIADERFLMAHGQRMTPGIGSDTSETLLADKEQREAIADAGRFVRKVGQGKWVEAIMHALGSPIVGAYRGAQMPMDEATRDVIGALLSKSPSELAKVLQEHGASAAQASHLTGILSKGGLFTDRARNIILQQVGKLAAGPSTAQTPPTPDKPAADDGNPFSQWAPKEEPKADSSTSSDDLKEPTAFTPDADVSQYLEYHLGVPVKITSSYRGVHHNQEVGGVKNSKHLVGEAWDFVPDGISSEEAGSLLAQSGMPFDVLEITPSHVHVSFSPANRGHVVYRSA